MALPEIPHSWLVAFLLLCLVILTGFGFNHVVQTGFGLVIGYLVSKQEIKLTKLLNSKK